jgi:tRNA (guanine-N7-)-methyltransferase
MGSSRKKLIKFSEVHEMKNVLETGDKFLKFKLWQKLLSKRKIILELACGRGEYAVYLAQTNKKASVWGVDIQGERIWHGAKMGQEKKILNLNFLRTNIEKIDKYFQKNSVDEIWITFPDPFSKEKRQNKRLTGPYFLKIYQKILKKNGTIHLKTDDEKFFDWSVEQFEKDKNFVLQRVLKDIYSQENLSELLKNKTRFEEKHLIDGKKIFYLQIKKHS